MKGIALHTSKSPPPKQISGAPVQYTVCSMHLKSFFSLLYRYSSKLKGLIRYENANGINTDRTVKVTFFMACRNTVRPSNLDTMMRLSCSCLCCYQSHPSPLRYVVLRYLITKRNSHSRIRSHFKQLRRWSFAFSTFWEIVEWRISSSQLGNWSLDSAPTKYY